jgi:serine/threonine protein kinase
VSVQVSCPEPGSLKALIDGALPPQEETLLSAHLDTCVRCQQALEGLVADSDSWADLPRRLSPAMPQPETALRQALARVTKDTQAADTQADATAWGDLPPDFLDPPAEPGHLGRLGPYEVLSLLGRGGMGVVLKAIDPSLQRVVAIKVLAPQLASLPTARKRFLREAQVAAAVSHDNIVAIHAVAEFKGLPYLVLQYIPGCSLEERLAGGPLEVSEIVRIAAQTAAGLQAAHARGLVHRDVKPANILLEEGSDRARLTDFGLARAVGDATLTQSGVVAGTPMYMAPEQARGEAVDHRADLFSLGSVLDAMCTGAPPFEADTPLAVLRRVSDEAAPQVRAVNPAVPDWLAGIIARLHAKDPATRFQTAGEVAQVLQRHLAQPPEPTPVEVAPAVPPTPQMRGRKSLVLAVAASLLAGLAVAGYQFVPALFRSRPTQSGTQPEPEPIARVPAPVRRGPSPDTPAGIPDPKLKDRIEVPLGEPFAQVCTGGAGRYLVFHLPKAKELAVFDVSQTKVIHRIDAPADDILLAAGLEKLLVVVPGQRLLQRWDLRSGEREKTTPMPEVAVVRQALMGCNSRGPLFLFYDKSLRPWDVDKMEPAGGDNTGLGGDPTYDFQARVSADGRAVAVWHGGLSGQQYGLVRLKQPKNTIARSPDGHTFNEHWAMPNADASLVFRFGSGIYDGDMHVLAADAFKGQILLPTEDPRFFLAIQEEKGQTNRVSICTSVDRRVAFTLGGIEKTTSSRSSPRWGLVHREPRIHTEPRVHYLPSANVLVNLPESNDCVVLRPLNLVEALKQSGQDFLVVLSRPEPRVAAGGTFTYRMEVHSRAGGLSYRIEAGPEGMTVSETGVVRWKAPERPDRKPASVVVTIRSASGKEYQHAFDVTVVESSEALTRARP